MKKLILIIFIVAASSNFGQFKNKTGVTPSIKDSFTKSSPSSLFLGFFHSEDFKVSHSINMSFTTFGGNNIMLGTYTGSFFYKISGKLNVSVDASLVTTPYNSFGKGFSQEVNGIYISRAQINYQPSENIKMSLLYFRPITGGYFNYGYWGRDLNYGNFNNSFLFDEFDR